MDLVVDESLLVAQPGVENVPHTERFYKVRSVLISTFMIITMMFSLIMAMAVIPSLVLVTFLKGIDHIVGVVGLPGLIIGALLTIIAAVSYFVLKAAHPKNLDELEFYHTGVPQGMITDIFHVPNRDHGRTYFGITVEGYNRQNQLRRQDHWVTASEWRKYERGQYISFGENTSA